MTPASQFWVGGVPCPRSRWGAPHLRLGGIPSQVWVGGYPISGLNGGGYPISGLDGGGYPISGLGRGVPHLRSG